VMEPEHHTPTPLELPCHRVSLVDSIRGQLQDLKAFGFYLASTYRLYGACRLYATFTFLETVRSRPLPGPDKPKLPSSQPSSLSDSAT